MRTLVLDFVFTATLGALVGACSDNATGSPCASADDCYLDVDRELIPGTIECLDRTQQGYCTHTCSSDADCCSIESECREGIPEVCAPFENSTTLRCFVSCEDELLQGQSGDDFCRTYAAPDFRCRSTGGGNQNRKVCFPGG